MNIDKIIKLLHSRSDDDIRLGWTILTNPDNIPDMAGWMQIFDVISNRPYKDKYGIFIEIFSEMWGEDWRKSYLIEHYNNSFINKKNT